MSGNFGLMIQALKTTWLLHALKSTIFAYFGHGGAALLAIVVCLVAVACEDKPQEQTNLDGATSDALISDAPMRDASSAGEDGSGATDTRTATVISGVAATGIALPLDSPVEASCVGGRTAAKTALGGAFTLQAEGLTFPCLLRAHYGTGEQRTTLYSVAIAAGTINITPLTHAIVTKAIVGDPEAAFAMPAQAMWSGLVAKLPSLQTKLRKLLADQGLGANVTGDFFTGPLRPASSTNAGDAHDQLLDAVIARFGQTEALVFAFSATLVDLGLSARVDWTQCAEAPRKSSEGYYSVGCSSRAVLLSSSPFSYASPQFVDGTILMRLSTTLPELMGGDCLLNIRYGETNPPSDLRPSWAGPGALHHLTGWNASARNSQGKFNGFGSGSGTLDGGKGQGTVVAVGLDSGSQVVSVSALGGAGEMRFSTQGPLSQVTMTDNSTCLWNAN